MWKIMCFVSIGPFKPFKVITQNKKIKHEYENNVSFNVLSFYFEFDKLRMFGPNVQTSVFYLKHNNLVMNQLPQITLLINSVIACVCVWVDWIGRKKQDKRRRLRELERDDEEDERKSRIRNTCLCCSTQRNTDLITFNIVGLITIESYVLNNSEIYRLSLTTTQTL